MFTGHMRCPQIGALTATLLSAVALIACGDGSDDVRSSTSPPTSTATTTLSGALADELGCSATTESEGPYWETRWGFNESLDCELDGRASVRLHTFDPERYDGVRSQLTTRYGDSGHPCPDGSAPISPWIVLGPDWAVVTSRREVARDLVDHLNGELLDGGGGTEGTPVSYPAVNDVCSS